MSEQFSVNKAYDELAQLSRMEKIENGKIEIHISEGIIEYPINMIVGARVHAGFPIELDFTVNGKIQTIKGIEGVKINGSSAAQMTDDLIALFE
jgi:hypothetical protein